MSGRSLIKSAGMVTILLVFSRVLGFLRESAIAYSFGTTAETDAYFVAATVPTILFMAFNDAVKTAFIPVYGEYHRREDGNAFAVTVFVIMAAILIFCSFALVLAAPLVARLLAPRFTGQQYEITVQMTRIMLPGLIFMGLTGLASAILHLKKNFFIPAITAYPSNLIIIFTALLFGARFGVVGLSWGTLLGFASQFFIQVPALAQFGLLRERRLMWHHPGLKRMAVLLPPVIIGSASTELKSVIDRIFGSMLPEGSISALNFASRIYLLPNGIIILALLTVLYPTLVELFMEEKMAEFKNTLRHGIGLIILLVFPMMVGLVVLRVPVVRLLFERGAFDAVSTAKTAFALAFYSWGLLPVGILVLFNRAFYAAKDTVTPMLVTLLTMGTNTFLNWTLMGPLQHGGIALGTAISMYIGAFCLGYLLWKKIGSFGGYQLFATFWKCGVASFVMGGVVWYGLRFLTGGSMLRQALEVGTLIVIGAAVYFLLVYVLKVEELEEALSLVRQRFKG